MVFEKNEMWEVVRDFNGKKALGPDVLRGFERGHFGSF